MLAYINPYYNQDFFGFFKTLVFRLFEFARGSLGLQDIVSDELQLIVLGLVSVSASLVGTTLILRSMAMLANSISHTILIGVVIAYLFAAKSDNVHGLSMPAFIGASIFMALITAFLTEWLTKSTKLKEDASTGIVFTTFFAIGIILVTLLTKSAHIGSEVVMGSADALNKEDISYVFWIALLNAALYLLFYKEYAITTFDPGLAKSIGISPSLFNYLLMIQTALTSVAAFRAVGVIMVLAFLTGPSLSARFLTERLGVLFFYSIGLSLLSCLLGVSLARHLLTVHGIALSTGGLVVACILALFLLTALFGPKRGILIEFFRQYKFKKAIGANSHQ